MDLGPHLIFLKYFIALTYLCFSIQMAVRHFCSCFILKVFSLTFKLVALLLLSHLSCNRDPEIMELWPLNDQIFELSGFSIIRILNCQDFMLSEF